MNVRTTVILLVLLLVCVTYVIVFHTPLVGNRPTSAPQASGQGERLFENVGVVQRLLLARPGAEKIVLVRRDEKWHLTEPVDAPAVGWQSDSTATNIINLNVIRKHAPNDAECPKDDLTHLSAPLRTVTFADDKGRAWTLHVGQPVPLTPRQCYVQLAGDGNVYVVDADLNRSLDKNLADYRESRVARFQTSNAAGVRVRGEQNYTLVRVNGNWAIDAPVAARANQEKVNSLLSDISNILAEEFVDDAPADLAAYGLARPMLTVTVQLQPPQPATTPARDPPAEQPKGKLISVHFGALADAKEKHIFAKLADRPWVFQVRQSLAKDLQPKLPDLRDKRVLDLGGKEVTGIELWLTGGGSATLAKIDGAWRMKAPFEGEAEDAAVAGLISALGDDLKAAQFQDNPASFAAFGLEPPQGRIVLRFRGSDQTATLLLGRSSDSGQMGFVRAANSRSVAVVPAVQFAKLLHPAPAYWTRKIFKLPDEAQVTRVDLARPDGQFALAREGDAFKLIRPVSAPTDKQNVEAMLQALKEIRAERNVSLNKELPDRFAQGSPIRVELTYRLELPPPAAVAPATAASAPASQPAKQYHTHQAGPFLVVKDAGKSYVWAEGASPIAVGELDADFYDKLNAEMRERTILKIDAERIVSFKREVGNVSLEFKRAGNAWKYASDIFVKVDAEKIKELFQTLSKIKATRFVDYSAKPKLGRFALDKPAMTFQFVTDSGNTQFLAISRTGPVGSKGHYAHSSDVPGVFIISPDAPPRMQKGLKDFQKSD